MPKWQSEHDAQLIDFVSLFFSTRLQLKHTSSIFSTQQLTQHNTTQHNTTQHNTTQHNTTQHTWLRSYFKKSMGLPKTPGFQNKAQNIAFV
jgi:hypothetical protein